MANSDDDSEVFALPSHPRSFILTPGNLNTFGLITANQSIFGTLRDTLIERCEIRPTCIMLVKMKSGQSEGKWLQKEPGDGTGVESYEATTHPFIVKIWLEETATEADQAMWRGYIIHVPSGQKHYVQDLDDITAFIAPYLDGMGVQLELTWRIRQWVKRQMLFQKKQA